MLGPGLYTSVRLATDRDTGRMRGFGHVDFKDDGSAEKAVAELNGLQVRSGVHVYDCVCSRAQWPIPIP